MTDQAALGVPAHILAQFESHEATSDLVVSAATESLLLAQGLNLELEPRAFLREFFKAHGRSISDDDIDLILDQYTVVPYVGDDGAAAAGGGAPTVGRLADGRRITVIRKTNRNRKLEALNMTGGLVEAAEETKRFKDAAGLGDASTPEKMNLERGESLPPLAFGSAHSVFFDSADAAINAMSQHALMAAAMVSRMSSNINKAKELVATQRRAAEIEASVTGVPAGDLPMTGALRAIMNQNKMLLETFTIGASSWLSGIYLPKITACLMTANTRPQSRVKAQTLLAKLDAVASKLNDDEDLPEDVLDELEEAHAAVYAEIRRAGLTAALTKQMRGPFSSFQKREDHQHARFVTAALREELYFFLATGPMSIGRRITLQQFPLPRMLVAAERFLDADVNGTVDAFREGLGHISALLPPDPLLGPSVFQGDQFDTGGSIQNVTAKTLRVERTGAGVEEAEAALREPGKTQTERHSALVERGFEDLAAADASSLKLNVTDTSRTNEDRAELRERATQRDRVSATESADFVRSGNFVFVTDAAAAGAPRSIKTLHGRTSIHHGLHAPAVVGNVLEPKRSEWMDASLPTEDIEAAVGAMLKRVEPADLDVSEKKRGGDELVPTGKRVKRSVKFADDDGASAADGAAAAAADDERALVGPEDPKPKRTRAPKAVKPAGRRMRAGLGVHEDGDEDAEAAAPAAAGRVPTRLGLRPSGLTGRGSRYLARCGPDGQLIAPDARIMPPVDDTVQELVSSRLIPSLMSARPPPSMREVVASTTDIVGGMLSLGGTGLHAPEDISSVLINRAILTSLGAFARGTVNSTVLGSFVASFRDTDPLLEGPALADDE